MAPVDSGVNQHGQPSPPFANGGQPTAVSPGQLTIQRTLTNTTAPGNAYAQNSSPPAGSGYGANTTFNRVGTAGQPPLANATLLPSGSGISNRADSLLPAIENPVNPTVISNAVCEGLSGKLDAIGTGLNNVNVRLQAIEKHLNGNTPQTANKKRKNQASPDVKPPANLKDDKKYEDGDGGAPDGNGNCAPAS